ncbi:MAG: basic secretory protein-like protein, partial [Candidatus Sericytochromatia bacterium]
MRKVIKKTILVSLSLLMTSCITPINIFEGLLEDNPSTITQSTIEAGTSNLVKYKDYAGEKDTLSDMVAISDEYKLKINRKDLLINKEVKLSIPINKTYIPDSFSDAQIQVESLDSKTGEWVVDGKFAYYDKDSNKVFFSSSLSRFITPSETLSTQNFKTKALEDEIEVVYRIRVYLFSDMVSATKDGSNFTIHYYPSTLIGNKSSVKKDSQWTEGTGSYGAPDIPNFVEDLDKALNEAYKKLLALKNSSGNVFEPLSTPIDVYIANTGGDAGDSPLGGPMRISNTKISTYQDLKETIAHEMVHVFQGQYYKISGLFSGRYNRWFIEAVANYYAAVATGLNDEQKKNFYGDFYNDYLSVGLQSSNDNSMYATAHFLDWLSTKYSSNIVGDALLKSSGNDMIGLSEAIKSSGETGGIGTAYEEYANYLITNPEGYAGFNKSIKDAMSSYSLG